MAPAVRFVPLLLAAAPLAPVLVLAPVPARAGEPLLLAWSAPAGCPSREDVLAETRRLLGGKIEGGAPLAARAEVVLAAPSDYRLRIALDRAPGERPREVHAPTCAELGDAAALILALSLDPVAVASAPPGGALHADPSAPPPPPPPEPLPALPPPSGFPGTAGQAGAASGDMAARGPNPPPSAVPGGPGVGQSGYPGGGSSGYSEVGPSGYPGVGSSGYSGVGPSGYPGVGSSGYSGAGSSGYPGVGSGGYSGVGPGGYPGGAGPVSGLAPRIPVPRFVQPVFLIPVVRPPLPAAPPRAVRLHASVAAEAGALRDLAPMVRAGVAFVPAPLRIEATGLLAWGGDIDAPSAPGKGAEFWLAGGALSACYEVPLAGAGPREIDVAACAGLEAGALVGASYGVTSPRSGLSPWLAPLAGGLFRWPLVRTLALRLDLQLAIPLVHPAFEVEGLGVVHAPGAVGARAAAGIELDL